MVRWTIFFLILLRLAIGWHFLVEGWNKVQSIYLVGAVVPVGETIPKQPFTSAGYFRSAPGPLGEAVRHYEGDPDDLALARLVVPPLPHDEDPATAKPHTRIPPGLGKDWDDYLERFAKHYDLDADQVKRAKDKLRQAKSAVVGWLTYIPPDDPALRDKDARYASMTTEETRTFPTGEVKRRMSMGERVAEYRAKVADLRDITDHKLHVFGKDVEGPKRLGEAKAGIAKLRAGLMADLGKESEKLKADLDKVLTPAQKEVGPVPPVEPNRAIETIDAITPWMLCAIGTMLLVGLFSRLGAFAGAMFLLMTYLAVPAFPWLPVGPPGEGNYLFVNKNVVEMLALFALAGVPTGRWFGLDALLHWLGTALWGKKDSRYRVDKK
jgi:uncharacterized membrane protein YphA (DoxX/SURF4 family)